MLALNIRARGTLCRKAPFADARSHAHAAGIHPSCPHRACLRCSVCGCTLRCRPMLLRKSRCGWQCAKGRCRSGHRSICEAELVTLALGGRGGPVQGALKRPRGAEPRGRRRHRLCPRVCGSQHRGAARDCVESMEAQASASWLSGRLQSAPDHVMPQAAPGFGQFSTNQPLGRFWPGHARVSSPGTGSTKRSTCRSWRAPHTTASSGVGRCRCLRRSPPPTTRRSSTCGSCPSL